MPQDEGVDASVVLGCGQWYLAHNTAQRRLLENSATPSQAGLQKKVSINTPVLVIFFGRPIYTNVTKLNYFWHLFLSEILLVLQKYIEQTFYRLPRTNVGSLRKERMLWEMAMTTDALLPLGTSCTQAVSARYSTTIHTEGVYKYDRHRA